MDLVIWIVFLLGAPAVLYWLWSSNRRRREQWRAWCQARGWRIDVDREAGLEAGASDRFPRLPIRPAHLDHASIDLRAVGPHGDGEAATWEWAMGARFPGMGGRKRRVGTTLHAVAWRLPVRVPARILLFPRSMALASMSGFIGVPDIETGIAPLAEGWRCHADDADAGVARAWLDEHRAALQRPHAAELALLQVDGDWLVAWHLGETTPARVDPALDWLSPFRR